MPLLTQGQEPSLLHTVLFEKRVRSTFGRRRNDCGRNRPTVSATRDSLHGPRQCKLRSRAIAASFINKAAYNRNERLCDNTSNEMSTSSSNTTEKRAHMKRLDEEPTCELARESLKNDQLGRREIVAQFIHLLYSVNGPYSIFIDAPWGTGKTFFVK